ncbi:MAG: hypothetical protein VX453_06180, partial [Acidobacteriota bacterium]|nr:hypothetical protein [Acidobacteriota bacterium]
ATLETAGYALPAGADIVARVVYKKTWITEGQEFSDETHFGLYLAEGQRPSIEHVVVNSPAQSGSQLIFTHTFTDEVTLYGILPEVGIAVAELQVVGSLPDGSSDPLLLIRNPDTGWPTRYRFDAPHTLPSGSEIRVTATLQPGATTEALPSLFDSEAPVRLLLDVTTETVAN